MPKQTGAKDDLAKLRKQLKTILSTKFHGLSLTAINFTRLIRPNAKTANIESEGMVILEGQFTTIQLESFIHRVCEWGHYPGIADRVLKDNEICDIDKAFKEAIHELREPKPNLSLAMIHLNQISGLGRSSFASKHLRFLRPELCPVLDSIIVNNSVYDDSPVDYEEFAEDCLKIANLLEQLGVRNPKNRNRGKWYAADVEVAIYTYLK